MNKPRRNNRVKAWHKWLGIPISFFALLFAISGIILNHRAALSGVEVSRNILPDYLQVENWNQSSIKTTLNIGSDSLLMYGGSGIWLTNGRHTFVERFEQGMKTGVENRNTAKIVKTNRGDIFAITTFDLYKLDRATNIWNNISSQINTQERLSDAAVNADTLVIISRSEIFTSSYPYTHFTKSTLATPSDYDGKVSLFRTIWRLHSGELFGEFGKIGVDLLGVVIIILSFTGIIIFLLPKQVRRLKRKDKSVSKQIALLKPSYKWHSKLGYWLSFLFLILFITGAFLRPPLLISVIRSDVKPLPYTTLYSDNAWNDRLRCINFDTLQNNWLLYTSEGFYSLEHIKAEPKPIAYAPRVSVMGVNVMKQLYRDYWIVGSFDGLVLWDRASGKTIDYLTKQPIMPRRPGPPQQQVAVTGFSNDFLADDIAFGYSFGARYIHKNGVFVQMPQEQMPNKISMWHLALEVHTGRIYQPIIGFFSDLYVFIAGVLLCVITITGMVMYRRKHKKRKSDLKSDR